MKYIFNEDNYLSKKYNKTIGQSGQLYMIENKDDVNEKWIVKNKYKDQAYNEFVASVIGNKIGLNMPTCKLGLFRGRVAVFIKYIEGLTRLRLNDIETESEVMREYLKQRFFSSIFTNDDHLEIMMDNSGKIWQIDNAEGLNQSTSYCMDSIRSKLDSDDSIEFKKNILLGLERAIENGISLGIKVLEKHEQGKNAAVYVLNGLAKIGEDNNDDIVGMLKALQLVHGNNNAAEIVAVTINILTEKAKVHLEDIIYNWKVDRHAGS